MANPQCRLSEPHCRLSECHNTTSSDREFQKPSFPTEDVEQYCEGGFHPLRVGSLFRGRYYIKGKLGFGGCGTVWWAKDVVQDRHVALKIITARASQKFDSLRTFYYLSSGDDRAPHHSGRNHVVKLIRSFWHKGPNGNHRCLVLELAGPRIEDYEKNRPSGGLTLVEIQKMTLDTSKAVAYMHVNGYIHGDLTPSNIFMGITDPRNWSEFQHGVVQGLSQSVSSEPLLRTNGETAQPSGPRIMTSPMTLWRLDPACITSEIIVGDLDASFPAEDGPEKNFILPPLHYSAPELLTQDIPRPPDMRTDIWSLGLTLFVIRAGHLLFPHAKDVNKMFISLWVRLGDSLALSEMWTAKGEYVDEDGNLMVHTPIHKPLKQIIQDIGRDIEEPITTETGSPMSAPSDVGSMLRSASVAINVKSVVEEWTAVPPSPAEVESFYDLLSRMLQIQPEKRIKIEEVLQHPWFTTEFEPKIPETKTSETDTPEE